MNRFEQAEEAIEFDVERTGLPPWDEWDVAELSDQQLDDVFHLCGGKGGTAGPCPMGKERSVPANLRKQATAMQMPWSTASPEDRVEFVAKSPRHARAMAEVSKGNTVRVVLESWLAGLTGYHGTMSQDTVRAAMTNLLPLTQPGDLLAELRPPAGRTVHRGTNRKVETGARSFSYRRPSKERTPDWAGKHTISRVIDDTMPALDVSKALKRYMPDFSMAQEGGPDHAGILSEQEVILIASTGGAKVRTHLSDTFDLCGGKGGKAGPCPQKKPLPTTRAERRKPGEFDIKTATARHRVMYDPDTDEFTLGVPGGQRHAEDWAQVQGPPGTVFDRQIRAYIHPPSAMMPDGQVVLDRVPPGMDEAEFMDAALDMLAGLLKSGATAKTAVQGIPDRWAASARRLYDTTFGQPRAKRGWGAEIKYVAPELLRQDWLQDLIQLCGGKGGKAGPCPQPRLRGLNPSNDLTPEERLAIADKVNPTLEWLEKLAKGEGDIVVFHGTTAERADRIATEGFKPLASGEAAARQVAELYDIPWDEWVEKVEPQRPGAGYGDETSRVSTGSYSIASRWAHGFPQGEVLSQLNQRARSYKGWKDSGSDLSYDDWYEQKYNESKAAWAKLSPEEKRSQTRPAERGLAPDRMPPVSGRGAVVAVTVPASAVPEMIRKRAKFALQRIAEGRSSAQQVLDAWKLDYAEIKIEPKHVKRISLLAPGGSARKVWTPAGVSSAPVHELSDDQVDELFFDLCGGKGGKAGPCPGPKRPRGTARGVGDKFADAPDKPSKDWVRKHQQDYDDDPEFRVVTDMVTLLAQGATAHVVMASRVAAGDKTALKIDDKVVRESYQDDLEKPFSLSLVNPMATPKVFFDGQGKHWDRPWEERKAASKGEPSLREAAELLNAAVDSAPPMAQPIFRGLHLEPTVWERTKSGTQQRPNPLFDRIAALKPGDSFDMPGVQSFTTDEALAREFSHRTARGQVGYERNRREEADYGGSRRYSSAVVVEVEAGARALPIASLSSWKQREVLTRGKFKVVSVKKVDRGDRPPDFHIVVKQHG